jgi:predicted phosphodiesterase
MRLVHISDLHFGLHEQEIVEVFQRDIKALRPEVIIISGDLTQRAQPSQFQMMQHFLHHLPAKVLVVPGNHDVPLYKWFARVLYPFKAYNHYIGQYVDAEFCDENTAILGVSSVNPFRAKKGRLTAAVLQKIREFFYIQNQHLNILFFHHNFDHITGLHKPLENEDQFVNYLQNSNIDIVCTGHLHYANVGLIRKNNERVCLILHAGSIFCSRKKDHMNSYFFLEGDREQCTVDWRVFSNHQFETHKNYTVRFRDKAFKFE